MWSMVTGVVQIRERSAGDSLPTVAANRLCGADAIFMKLVDLPTPCLVLDRLILRRNLQTMAASLRHLGVPLRPHMKTAKSIDVARLATEGQPGGITVSTLAEAEYFLRHGITDMLYAVGITPQKLQRVCALNGGGAEVI